MVLVVEALMRRSVNREVTVVIPTYGAGTCLTSVLRGLAAQDHRDFEVIVVDNNPRQKWNPSLPGRHLPTSGAHEPSEHGCQTCSGAISGNHDRDLTIYAA